MLIIFNTLSSRERGYAEKLYNDYRAPMFHYAVSLLADTGQAEDATQQAFLKLLGKLDLLQGLHKDYVSAYVAMTVRNVCNDYHRKRRREKAVPLPDLSDIPGDQTVEDQYIALYQSREIHHAMGVLTDMEKDLLTLRFAFDQPYREIAGFFHITEGNARVKVHRAVSRLRVHLAEREVI